MTPAQAQRDIRGFAIAGRVFIAPHARKRMREREFTEADVLGARVNTLKRCVKCKHSPLTEIDHEDIIDVGSHRFVAVVPARQCPGCGERYVALTDVGRFEQAVARELIDSGNATAQGFRFMRKVIGLPAIRLATLLAVSPETISRWENGKRAVERRALALLQLLVVDHLAGSSATADRLRTLADHSPHRPQTVRVAL